MEMMQPNNRTIELLEPEEYRKKHPKPEDKWRSNWGTNNNTGKVGGFGGGFGKFTDNEKDDICTVYD